MLTLKALADRFGLPFRGDPDTPVYSIGTLAKAGPGQLSFLANGRYAGQLAGTRASVVVVSDADVDACPCACLIAPNPYASFALISALFDDGDDLPAGVHPTAVVTSSAMVAADARIGPYAVVGERAVIGAGAQLHAHVHVGKDCVVGDECMLMPKVTLVKRVRLGRRVRVHSGAVLGADGFGIAAHEGRWTKIAQLGGVEVGDDCEIGANTTIDRGAIEDTVLENDVRLDNQVQVGHNVRIGAHTAVAGCAAIAGSTRIGRWCLIGGAAGIVGHLEIGDRVTIGAMSLVTHSLREPGEYASGTPIQPKGEWRRNAARFARLDALAREFNTLKKSRD